MTVVALVGRPNVGKSSIFNRLAGKQMAIVHDTPGVTRDYKLAEATLGQLSFTAMDTAGLEEVIADDPVQSQMQGKTIEAVRKADALLFVIDGQTGITPIDQDMARKVRQWNKHVILVVNKADDRKSQGTALESFSLGLGVPVLLSSAHNLGFEDLEESLAALITPDEPEEIEERFNEEKEFTRELTEEDEVVEEDPMKPLKVAIVGRPNVGKSTLLNTIIGEERAITSPVAGTTRDTVMVQWEYKERIFRLVDTAGLRRRSKVIDRIEKMSASETQRAIRLAHVVILVLDASLTLDQQDQAIADHVLQEGRALIIAVNKWDTVTQPDALREELRYRLGHALAQVKDIPLVTISALTGRNVPKLLDSVLDIYKLWNSRVSTSKLNRWVERMEEAHPAPMASGRPNRLRYMTQIKVKPPTFRVWVSRPDEMPDSYERYLVNGLRRDFDLPGIPIRLNFRTSKNPFAGKKD